MNSRFFWLLIFALLNTLILLALALFAVYIPTTQTHSLILLSLLTALLIADILVLVLPALAGDRTIPAPAPAPVVPQPRRTAPAVQPLTVRTSVPPQPGFPTPTPDTPPPTAATPPPALDRESLLAARYPEPAPLQWPVQTYIAGTWLPGTLMGYYPGDPGTLFLLERDAQALDPAGIRVCTQSGHCVGWIPRPLNRQLAPLLDQGLNIQTRLEGCHQVCQSQRMDIRLDIEKQVSG